jgi:hypothetical protein
MSQKDFSNLRAAVNNSTAEISCYLTTPLYLSRTTSDDSVIIRVLRCEEKAFTFNHDYAEYFDGLNTDDAEVIFEGAIELINHRKIVYKDATVKNGATYVYWISLSDKTPTGPVAVRVRDMELWWPNSEIVRRMQTLAETYPQVQMREFGKTVRGNSIAGLVAGNPKKMIAFIGAIHPGESGPELIVPAIERVLQEHPKILNQIGIAILPSVCIDQREKMVQGNPWYLRKNFKEVDLNRNFPSEWETVEYTYGLITSDPDAATYRGASPCSEPETCAVMNFIEATKPLCVFSYHCLAGICGPSFFTAKSAAEDIEFKKQCKKFATPFQNGFYGNTKKQTSMKFACTAGSLTSWLYHEWKIPGFDLEWDGDEKSKISHTDNVTRELMTEYQDRHYAALLHVLQENL